MVDLHRPRERVGRQSDQIEPDPYLLPHRRNLKAQQQRQNEDQDARALLSQLDPHGDLLPEDLHLVRRRQLPRKDQVQEQNGNHQPHAVRQVLFPCQVHGIPLTLSCYLRQLVATVSDFLTVGPSFGTIPRWDCRHEFV